MSGAQVTRVVLVDDHPVVRDGLRALLETVDDIEVVGEAGSGEEALELVARTRPSVVVMDIDMPGMGGLEATRRIVKTDDPPAVLVLTMYGEDPFVRDALQAGAHGYLVKGAQQVDMLFAIRGVGRGNAVLGPDATAYVRRSLASETTPVQFPELTQREREVLTLLADAMSNIAIARRLGVSPKTVANHVSNVLTKIQAVDRADAIERARRAGLGAAGL